MLFKLIYVVSAYSVINRRMLESPTILWVFCFFFHLYKFLPDIFSYFYIDFFQPLSCIHICIYNTYIYSFNTPLFSVIDKTSIQKLREYRRTKYHYQPTWLNWHYTQQGRIYILFRCKWNSDQDRPYSEPPNKPESVGLCVHACVCLPYDVTHICLCIF